MSKYVNGRFQDVFPSLDHEGDVTAMTAVGSGVVLSTLARGTIKSVGASLQRIVPAQRSLVLSLAQGSDGRLWLGTRDQGLLYVANGRTYPVGGTFPDKKINVLLPVEDGQLWVGTDDGLARWDGKRMVRVLLSPRLKHLQVLSIVRDQSGNLWLGTSEGLARYNAEGVSFLRTAVQPSAPVIAVFKDRDGDIWFGDGNSLQQIRQGAFISFSASEGLPGNTFGPVAIDSHNRVWSAPLQGGLFWFKEGKVRQVTADGLGTEVIYSIQASADGVWVGRQRGGLTHLRTDASTQLKSTTYTQTEGLAENHVYALHVNRDQSVWAGTLTSGASHLENGNFRTYTVADGLASNEITAIAESSAGTMWFGGPNGLSSFSRGEWHRLTTEDGLPSSYINCITQGDAGVLWVGTARGLAYIVKDKIGVVGSSQPLFSQSILGISKDQSGFLWIAAEHGVFRVRIDDVLKHDTPIDGVSQYGIKDGLRGSEGVRRDQSVTEDTLGSIWFALSNGLSRVEPDSLEKRWPSPIVQIQGALVDGRPGLSNSLRIPPGTNRVVFLYAGLSFANLANLRFRFRLDGFDRGWNGPVTTREAVYTNLPPGRYRFRVMASIQPDSWDGKESDLLVSVEPSLQQSWFSKALLILAVGALAALGYVLRTRYLMSQAQLRADERLSERTRIARELHDTLLQSIIGVSLYLQFASRPESSEDPHGVDLQPALERLDAVIEEGRLSVQGLRSPYAQRASLQDVLTEIYSQLPGSELVKLISEVSGKPSPLLPSLFDEICFICREALLNVLRHAEATKVEISIDYSINKLLLDIRDDGRGIETSLLVRNREGHFGLRGMQERAGAIGGRLSVERPPTGGTRVVLIVPARKAYRRAKPKDL